MTQNFYFIISSVAFFSIFSVDVSCGLAQKVNCENPLNTQDMNICAGQEYKVADRKLNQVYRQLQSRLSGKQKQRMTDAQLTWIKFRDANCDSERGQFEGGTMNSHVGTTCLAGMTEKRKKELEEYLQNLNSR